MLPGFVAKPRSAGLGLFVEPSNATPAPEAASCAYPAKTGKRGSAGFTPARNCAWAGVTNDPAGNPNVVAFASGTRPKLLAPIVEKPVSFLRVTSAEKK